MSESNGQPPVPDVFDEFLPPKEVKIRGRDGNIRTYLVGESTGGEDFWKWAGKMSSLADNPQEVVASGTNISELQTELICQCVTCDGKPVTRDIVLGWGMSLRKYVFETCQEVNGMSRGESTAGKALPAEAPSGGGTKLPAVSV